MAEEKQQLIDELKKKVEQELEKVESSIYHSEDSSDGLSKENNWQAVEVRGERAINVYLRWLRKFDATYNSDNSSSTAEKLENPFAKDDGGGSSDTSFNTNMEIQDNLSNVSDDDIYTTDEGMESNFTDVNGHNNSKNVIIIDSDDAESIEEINEAVLHYIKIPKNIKSFDVVIINVLNYDTVIIECSFSTVFLGNRNETCTYLLKEMNDNVPKQPVILEPYVGQACCALSEDKNWYRAEIYSVDELASKGLVKVLYVDYGNLDVVPKENIKMLKKEWTYLAVQQLKCKIAGIKITGNISEEDATKYMRELLIGRNLVAMITKTKPMLEARFLDLAYQEAIDKGVVAMLLRN